MPYCVPHLMCALPHVWQGGIRVIQEWIIGQRSKIVLRNKEMFLDYGGDEEFGVKGYVDASFNTNPDDSE